MALLRSTEWTIERIGKLVISDKAVYFIEAAMDVIKEEILNSIAHRKGCKEVPCEEGLVRFNRLVKDYWKLAEIAGCKADRCFDAIERECVEAMCEVPFPRD